MQTLLVSKTQTKHSLRDFISEFIYFSRRKYFKHKMKVIGFCNYEHIGTQLDALVTDWNKQRTKTHKSKSQKEILTFPVESWCILEYTNKPTNKNFPPTLTQQNRSLPEKDHRTGHNTKFISITRKIRITSESYENQNQTKKQKHWIRGERETKSKWR